jgi:hypothetical protein
MKIMKTFSVTVRTEKQQITYQALAYSSGAAHADALNRFYDGLCGVTVKLA